MFQGHCIPSSCSKEDVYWSFTHFLQNALNRTDLIGFATECHTADEEIKMDSDDWGFVAVLLIFAAILSFGTLVDVCVTFFDITFFPERLVQVFQDLSVYHNTMKIFK